MCINGFYNDSKKMNELQPQILTESSLTNKILNEKYKSQEYIQNDAIYVKVKNSENQITFCS